MQQLFDHITASAIRMPVRTSVKDAVRGVVREHVRHTTGGEPSASLILSWIRDDPSRHSPGDFRGPGQGVERDEPKWREPQGAPNGVQGLHSLDGRPRNCRRRRRLPLIMGEYEVDPKRPV
jgi:hypothetical protein